jgi:two-component system chemotaxis response regulator CheB
MPDVRVVIASATVGGRRALSNAATGLGGVVVAAATPDGRTTLTRVQQYQPDAVILDADIDAQTAQAVRRACPTASVLVVVGRNTTAEESLRHTGATLVSNLADLPNRLGITVTQIRASAPAPAPTPRRNGTVELVAIGSSTGGPAALATLLQRLPSTLPVPVLLVQHMPANFTRVLASRLDAATTLNVREAQGGEHPRAGEVWLAPGDRHMTVTRENDQLTLRVNSDAPECFCRPSVDVLFRSIAASVGGGCVAVVLTGMGQDGLRGATLLKEAGATVLAQDEATSVVWGMPGYVARAGLATRVLPIEEIASEILGRVAVGRPMSTIARRELGRGP